MRRYAVVRGHNITADKVADYLPSNYRVDGIATEKEPWGNEYPVVIISGVDDHGWTMERYVIPRLGSGNMGCKEVGLDHPALKTIPVE